MKAYCADFNSVLAPTMHVLREAGELTDNPHMADVFVLWQDVRGAEREIAHIARHQLKKPVLVMQHGRGATRDYCAPNKFPLTADKIMVWGQAEKDRMIKHGHPEGRIEVVGCPLFPLLRKKPANREGVNILFAPVIAQKEEPENVMVFAALKEWESKRLLGYLRRNFDGLKRAWATQENEFKDVPGPGGIMERRLWRQQVTPRLSRNVTYSDGLINVKLTGVHDAHQYLAPICGSNQGDANHIKTTIELLLNVDVMVCLEEGTMQLLAHALDIPVIVCDIFRYGEYGGTEDYDRVEKIHTSACYWTDAPEKVGHLIERALANPAELRMHRIEVCEREGGANLNIPKNILETIHGMVRSPVLC